MPAPRGDLCCVHPWRSQHGDGKIRISSLPKDMCLEVLPSLPCTCEAMRTSILSDPWRLLWKELRELTFDNVVDLDWLLSTLAEVQPKLNWLCIQITIKLGASTISPLLHAADKQELLELIVRLCKHRNSHRVVPLCFARATLVELHIPGLWLKLPPTGSFVSIERLTLYGPSIIDPSVLLPRCPCLRMLKLDSNCPQGVENTIWHLSLLKMKSALRRSGNVSGKQLGGEKVAPSAP